MRKLIVIFIICFGLQAQGSKISDAYEALSVFDYFKAKQLFYKSLEKFPSQSSYGLATIYFRTDNPFSNIDSAAKYIAISQNSYKDSITYSLYHINSESIKELAIRIGNKGFEKYSSHNSVESYNYFLSHYYFSDSSVLAQTFLKRDVIQLGKALNSQSSYQVTQFLLQYPQSSLYQKAQKLFYDYQFTEQTSEKTIRQYQVFIKQFPNNPNVTNAEITLFNLIQSFHSSDSIYNFIKHYSTSLTQESAWKLLYSLSVNKYSKDELTAFLNKYPDYPYNENVLKEITLSQNILIPLKDSTEKIGFIDTLGNWIIKPQYDDALPFSEGFASVCKNDSCFYINKEGLKVSSNYFEETESYKDGIAIVKKDNAYFLINRSGQIISKGYQDINESYHKLYVCKLNNTYGAINAKGEIIIPFNYNKLGNFKNKFAYYLSNKYGLVDIDNRALTAQWDWVSDVDTNSIAIVKKKNQFGLMTIYEEILLPTEYDYITHCQDDIYLIVKNDLYGFYNSKEKCFVTSVEYNYNSSFDPEYYTNKNYFKLIKDDEVALVDANGRYSINFGTYSNLFFAKCDIIRIQKKNKFGFVDRKLKPVTPVEFDKAKDFENNIAIVSKGANTMMIDKTGKIIYTIKNGEITSTLNKLYQVKQNDLIGLLNDQGQLLLNIEFESVNLIYNELYACQKNNELYLFNLKTKSLKKL
jgi:hypothetical protein